MITLKKLSKINSIVGLARLLRLAGFRNYRSLLKRIERDSPELTSEESRMIIKQLQRLKKLL